jgi:hypothetical protein
MQKIVSHSDLPLEGVIDLFLSSPEKQKQNIIIEVKFSEKLSQQNEF